MDFLVLVKQVPDTEKVKIDPVTGTMVREGLEITMNPLDAHALELVISLKEKFGGTVTVLSMGPMNTVDVLRDAIALGADRAILLSDSVLAGSDTWATSFALAKTIEKLNIKFDLLVCGEKSTDGETGQVGIELATLLNLPVVTYVSELIELGSDFVLIRRSVEDAHEIWKAPLPACLCVLKSVAEPRLPTLAGKKRAMDAKIEIYDTKLVGIRPEEVGLKGSPTRVVKVFNTKIARNCRMYADRDVAEGIERVIELIKTVLEGEAG
ncbi:MAG: Electron transfer flavoprotein alpha/beta-subunit [Thermotoga sp. 50_1627]|uniref:electron transfer flavoprotein subunit beta/FixA family protein n=1 Tax=Pseudothermotoga sp. TaxID=2033661 RepID=UPI00076DAA56|nr:MAG: Electron transfer flavoprotein alpha/beta-subunit [Thermotoga sp. 50_64]KUK24024.1 MAG: Electron transfer flavoprotein alpha/beta-subunit [Thermotoga sp. 50_1627]MBC7116529.1 electron transfer flavoprotein subunit beta/FixA family protein [Pseudothermotoga sp.]HBT39350.1 electron transfer flavoprotein subunit beta [Pseudothermotoga sp.]HCO97565.1 electron transfer flavoprotein subunit beta [Pseudothermotoga sp.]